MIAHTPGPLIVVDDHPQKSCLNIVSGIHEVAVCYAIGSFEQAKADAEFIVRACNSHDGLLAALRDLVAVFDSVTLGLERERRETALPKARAAIATAEGKS